MARRRWRPHRKVSQRRKQLQSCPSCYLDPDPKDPGYPVCPKTSCAASCDGLLAAHNRATQQGRDGIAREAKRRARNKGCPWAG